MVFEKVIKLNRSSGRALIQPACCHHKGRGQDTARDKGRAGGLTVRDGPRGPQPPGLSPEASDVGAATRDSGPS